MTDDAALPPATLEPDRERPGAWWVRTGGVEQCHVDPEDPELLQFDYMQRIAEAIDAFAPAGKRLRVVHVGGSAMALPRYVAATRPTSAQIVMEPDTDLTEAVRQTVPLPKRSGIKVRGVDGRSGIAAMRDDWADIIIVDAFAGARVPAELTTVEHLTDLRRVLTGAGLLSFNITDLGQLAYTRRVLAGVREVFGEVALVAESSTLKGRRFGNLIIHAGTGLPVDDLARTAARSVFPYRIVSGPHLARFCGAVRPWTDDDSSPSPEPPNGPLSFR